MNKIYLFLFMLLSVSGVAQVNSKLQSSIDKMAKDIEPKLIEWRRHFHQNPELSNREVKTAARVAEHLKSLGLKFKLVWQKQE